MVVTVMVEIPKGSRNKYEYDKEKKVIRFDRTLFRPSTIRLIMGSSVIH